MKIKAKVVQEGLTVGAVPNVIENFRILDSGGLVFY